MAVFKGATMRSVFVIVCILLASTSFAWDGYDSENGSSVEIEKGNLVRSGQEIEVYDYNTGEYNDVEVQSIRGNGSTVEVEVYDYSTGEYRTFEMDKE
jgi:hypothetical protein